MKKIRLGAGSGYAPSDPVQAVRLIERGNVNYLGFDQLAELTMSICAIQKLRDPAQGYVTGHIVDGMKLILPRACEKGVKLITNGGGVNCEEAANQVIKIAKENGINNLKVAIVRGDDVSGKLAACREKGWKFKNLDTGEEDIDRINDNIVAANTYIGADAIIGALEAGADVVIAGRCSDNALFVAPIMYEFGWKFEEKYVPLIGAAVTIGHTIECADFCCGFGSVVWEKDPKPWDIGYPLAEVYEDGTAILEKTPGTGGLMNEWNIKAQLVYEVHDPQNYLMPDGIADMTAVHVEDLGNDRVRLTNMTGKSRPDTLKVQIGYRAGYIAEILTVIPAPKALSKARRFEENGWQRLAERGIKREDVEVQVDFIGVNSALKSIVPVPDEDAINEIGVRVAAKGKTRGEAQRLAAAFQDLSPVGTGFSAPQRPRTVIALWPTLIPREEVPVDFVMKEVD